MGNTTFRHLKVTTVIQSPGTPEKILPCLGDGAGIPGDLASIGSDRKMNLSQIGTNENFSGLVKEHILLGTETAITSGIKAELVAPIAGRDYVVRIVDQTGTKEIGFGLTYHSTAGKATTGATLLLSKLAKLARPIATGDTICIATWKGE